MVLQKAHKLQSTADTRALNGTLGTTYLTVRAPGISSDHHLHCLQCQAPGFQPWQINGTGISLPPLPGP